MDIELPEDLTSAVGGTELAPRSSISEVRGKVAFPEGRGSFRSTTFSIFAGIVAPIVCLALQPVLLPYKTFMLPGLSFINEYWSFGYGVIGLEMLVLATWLALGKRLGTWNGFVSGMLFAGALFSGGLGIVLLPFSIAGLLFLIGALGFVPFFTAWIYYANAVHAYQFAGEFGGGAKRLGAALLGAMLVLGVPGAVQMRVSQAMDAAIRDVTEDPSGLSRLRSWYPLLPPDRLVWAYYEEWHPVSKQRLADAYRELTGEDVESRLKSLTSEESF